MSMNDETREFKRVPGYGAGPDSGPVARTPQLRAAQAEPKAAKPGKPKADSWRHTVVYTDKQQVWISRSFAVAKALWAIGFTVAGVIVLIAVALRAWSEVL